MTDWPLHPVAALFRDMDADAFAALTADIRAHGVLVPVTLWAGQLVDGRHRARACREIGIPCPSVTTGCAEDELPALVWSLNAERRHLTIGERGMVSAKMANMKHGSNQYEKKVESPQGDSTPDAAPPVRLVSRAEAAKIAGIGTSTHDRAVVVLKSGDTELIKQVEQGDMPLATAEKIVRKRSAQSKPKNAVIPIMGSGLRARPKFNLTKVRTNALYAIQTQARILDQYAAEPLPDGTTCREWNDVLTECLKSLRKLQHTINAGRTHERRA